MIRAQAINLQAELRKLPGFQRRRVDTDPAKLEGTAFGDKFDYRDGYISTVKFSGVSAWERHSGDELLLIAEGSGYLLLIDEDGFVVPRSLSENMLIIVPSGRWHQIESEAGISMVTVSPQPTDHQAERP
jgi:mannose-6-phosphate isomerase-like protein (cupin superfamily)